MVHHEQINKCNNHIYDLKDRNHTVITIDSNGQNPLSLHDLKKMPLRGLERWFIRLEQILLSEDSSVPSTHIRLAALAPVSGKSKTPGLTTGHLHSLAQALYII